MKPSSLTLTKPLRTICELNGDEEPRFGEPPIPPAWEGNDDIDGEELAREKEGEYPLAWSVEEL